MSERTTVRPVFRWLAGLAFVLALIPATVAGWDFVETRAFRRILDDVRAKNQPLTLGAVRPRPTSEEGLASDRLFRAAVVLATWTPDEQRLFNRVREASRTGEWPDELAASARRYVGQHSDALQLLDRAAPMRFEGLAVGGESTSAALFQLARLAAMRTSMQILDRDDAHMIDALYAELRYRQVVDWAWGLFRVPVGELERVGLVLSSTHPPPPALARIASALAEFDRDDVLKQWFLGQRVVYFTSFFGRSNGLVDAGFGFRISFADRFGRAWVERTTLKRLETMAAVIAVLDQPWPLRATAVAALYDTSQPGVAKEFRLADVGMSNQLVDDLALVRAARVAVAVEQYRRGHRDALPGRLDDLVPDYLKAVPVDPYSGWPLMFRNEVRTYAVYSLGPNRRDDNADFTLLRFVDGGRQSRDIGVRIQYR